MLERFLSKGINFYSKNAVCFSLRCKFLQRQRWENLQQYEQPSAL
jgi:hypothetical protein